MNGFAGLCHCVVFCLGVGVCAVGVTQTNPGCHDSPQLVCQANCFIPHKCANEFDGYAIAGDVWVCLEGTQNFDSNWRTILSVYLPKSDPYCSRATEVPDAIHWGKDTDGDGVPDFADTDDDADGVADASDSCPKGVSSGTDSDGDGCKDSEDTDDDNDGINDGEDSCPAGASGTDTDGDGCADSEDSDDDGDGINDVDDACPTGGTGTDTDGDGCTDAEDFDDDGDGVTDLDDLCQTSKGPATRDGCPYVCAGDEAGGGLEPCKPCGDGEAPHDEGTVCVVCPHGESSPPGRCEPDHCMGVSCGANAYCSQGVCLCNRGFEDPDNDDVCTKECPTGQHDSDADGVCTKVCGYKETDVVAKTSLMTIPKEPWERGESYLCNNNAVVAGFRVSTRNNQNVCEISSWTLPSNAVAFGHSHPYFTWDPSLSAAQNTVMCHGVALNTKELMKSWNAGGQVFSWGDTERAKWEHKPFYLVVPERNLVKVYRPAEGCKKGAGCPWRAWNL